MSVLPQICILSSVHIALDNRVFYREACSLSRAGYDVTLIAVHDRDEVKDGVRILSLPRVPRWQRPLLWLRLCRHALATDAHIFHFHDPELLLVASLLRLVTRKPVIYDVHEANEEFIKVKDYLPAWIRYPVGWGFGRLEPLLARLTSGLVFADEQIARSFQGLRKPQVTLFNFPLTSLIEAGEVATRDSTVRPPVVLHLGGHERNRGTGLMIEAFHQVLKQMPEARLALVGPYTPTSLEHEVAEDIAQRGIGPAVTMTGRVPFEQVGRYLTRSALGWVAWQNVPKNAMNIPTKLFEYMAYRLPIVSSDLPSIRPFVTHMQNGYLVPPGDANAHAQAILELLRSPVKARQMGDRGWMQVRERFNWSSEEPKLLRLYAGLLGCEPNTQPENGAQCHDC
jgi:glycosyltransferase involved in cell wall biosynthesis